MDGGSEDEDTKLVREFEMLKNKIDPQNNAKLAAHLNLIWSVSEVCFNSREKPCGAPLPCLFCWQDFNFLVSFSVFISYFLFVLQRKRPERCECCSGSGERECPWCHGTGAMTVGDTLFCTHEGCRPCPVCKGGVREYTIEP